MNAAKLKPLALIFGVLALAFAAYYFFTLESGTSSPKPQVIPDQWQATLDEFSKGALSPEKYQELRANIDMAVAQKSLKETEGNACNELLDLYYAQKLQAAFESENGACDRSRRSFFVKEMRPLSAKSARCKAELDNPLKTISLFNRAEGTVNQVKAALGRYYNSSNVNRLMEELMALQGISHIQNCPALNSKLNDSQTELEEFTQFHADCQDYDVTDFIDESGQFILNYEGKYAIEEFRSKRAPDNILSKYPAYMRLFDDYIKQYKNINKPNSD